MLLFAGGFLLLLMARACEADADRATGTGSMQAVPDYR